MAYDSQIIRIKSNTSTLFDNPTDLITGGKLTIFAGNTLDIQVGVFDSGSLTDVSGFASAVLEIKPRNADGTAPDEDDASYLSKSVVSFDNTTTLTTWNNGTKQHIEFSFTDDEMKIPVGSHWVSCYVVTSGGDTIVLFAGDFIVKQPGTDAGTPTYVDLGETYYTASAIDTAFVHKVGTDTITGSLGIDNIKIDGNAIISTDTAGDITITPDTTGDLILDGLKWPQADGTADYVLKTDGAGQLSWVAQGGGISWSTAVNADIVPDADGTRDLGATATRFAETYTDALFVTNNATITGDLDVDNLNLNGNTIISTNLNGNIVLTPNGTGDIVLGTLTVDGDQTVGAGQDGYVLKYDHSSGKAFLQAGSGGGISNVVEDTSPQLGGDLDANAFDIQFDDATGIRDDSDNETLIFGKTVSAVNYTKISNAATGNDVVIEAAGDDTNIGLTLTPKGTGNISLGNFTFDADATVGSGQDNYVMTYDNASGTIGLEAAGGGGGAWTFISSQTASSSSSIDFTGLSSTYRMYRVVIDGVVPATNAAAFYIRTSTDGGTSYDSGASDYTSSSMYTYSTIGSAGQLRDTSTAYLKLAHDVGNASNRFWTGYVDIIAPSEAQYGTLWWNGMYWGSDGNLLIVTGGGQRKAAADIDAIRFLFSTGNISTGTFKLYGLSAS